MTKLVTFIWCCILLTIGVALPTRAQADFRPGYIVLPAGDTLRGELDYRDGRFSSQHCRFRLGPAAVVTTYGPGELRAYCLAATGQTYRAIALPQPTTTPVTNPGLTPTFFLEVLIDGPATLYFLRNDDPLDHFYLRSPTFSLAELAHEIKEVQVNGSLYRQELNGFRSQLNRAFSGCPMVLVQLPRLLFRESALRQVVAVYNACVEPGGHTEPAETRSQEAYLVSAVVGLQSNTLVWYDSFYPDYQITRKIAPVLGLEVELRNPRVSRRVNLVAGLFYAPQKLTAAYSYGFNSVVSTSFTNHLVKAPLLMRYSSPKGAVRVLAEAGVAFFYTFAGDGSSQLITASSGPPTLPANGQYGNTGFGGTLLGGVGVSTSLVGQRPLAVRVRFENKLNDPLGQSPEARIYSLLLSYQLFK